MALPVNTCGKLLQCKPIAHNTSGTPTDDADWSAMLEAMSSSPSSGGEVGAGTGGSEDDEVVPTHDVVPCGSKSTTTNLPPTSINTASAATTTTRNRALMALALTCGSMKTPVTSAGGGSPPPAATATAVTTGTTTTNGECDGNVEDTTDAVAGVAGDEKKSPNDATLAGNIVWYARDHLSLEWEQLPEDTQLSVEGFYLARKLLQQEAASKKKQLMDAVIANDNENQNLKTLADYKKDPVIAALVEEISNLPALPRTYQVPFYGGTYLFNAAGMELIHYHDARRPLRRQVGPPRQEENDDSNFTASPSPSPPSSTQRTTTTAGDVKAHLQHLHASTRRAQTLAVKLALKDAEPKTFQVSETEWKEFVGLYFPSLLPLLQ